MRNKTGGKRLGMLIGRVPFEGGMWIDTYNQLWRKGCAGTVKARIDNCMYYITQKNEK